MQDRPTAAELLATLTEYLEGEVLAQRRRARSATTRSWPPTSPRCCAGRPSSTPPRRPGAEALAELLATGPGERAATAGGRGDGDAPASWRVERRVGPPAPRAGEGDRSFERAPGTWCSPPPGTSSRSASPATTATTGRRSRPAWRRQVGPHVRRRGAERWPWSCATWGRSDDRSRLPEPRRGTPGRGRRPGGDVGGARRGNILFAADDPDTRRGPHPPRPGRHDLPAGRASSPPASRPRPGRWPWRRRRVRPCPTSTRCASTRPGSASRSSSPSGSSASRCPATSCAWWRRTGASARRWPTSSGGLRRHPLGGGRPLSRGHPPAARRRPQRPSLELLTEQIDELLQPAPPSSWACAG